MAEPLTKTLAASSGTAIRPTAGEALKIVSTHGTQVVNCWAFNANDLDEWMSMAHTRYARWKLTPTIGESFVTNHRDRSFFLLRTGLSAENGLKLPALAFSVPL